MDILRYAPLLVVALVLSGVSVCLYFDNAALRHENSELKGTVNSLNLVVNELNQTVLLLEAEKVKLEERNSVLTRQLEDLRLQYNSLYSQYSVLSEQFNELTNKHRQLQSELESATSALKSLRSRLISVNGSLASIAYTLEQYAFIPNSFKRVLSEDEIRRLAPYAASLNLRAEDPWFSYRRVYEYVVSNIRYSKDQWMPAPISYACDILEDVVTCTYILSPYQQIVQTPHETLVRGEGDCEDQAILLYAMIAYYHQYIHGSAYLAWLAHMVFKDGSGHMAVFLPTTGGRLTILDPAGRYVTSWLSIVVANDAYQELLSYSRYWSDYGGIDEITLYYVDPKTGDYRVDARGNMWTIANYIRALAS